LSSFISDVDLVELHFLAVGDPQARRKAGQLAIDMDLIPPDIRHRQLVEQALPVVALFEHEVDLRLADDPEVSLLPDPACQRGN